MAQEIERKFLVLDTSYRTSSTSRSHITQGYLTSGGGCSVRIRLRDHRGYLTIKGPSADGGLSRYEFETEVSLSDATELMKLAKGGIIEKTRWLVPTGDGHTFEVDEFAGDNAGLVMAEVELGHPDEPFVKPPFIGREVTGDRRFYNSHLRSNPFRLWRDDVPPTKGV